MNILKKVLSFVHKSLDFFLYYSFLIDLYLLTFFGKKIPYLFFIFCYFFGTFGYSESLNDLQYICKFSCLVFSWYLGSTSFIVFCVFNIPVTKDYLNNLLGKEFVVSKIGNPGFKEVCRFAAVVASGVGVNEAGKFINGQQIAQNANETLENTVRVIHDSPDLTSKERGKATQEALKVYSTMCQVKPEGTLDRAMRHDAQKDMVARVSGIFYSKK